MIVTEETKTERASKELNNQLEALDLRAVSELVSELREARMVGYDYVDINKLERGLLAVAGLQGLTDALSAEEALRLLADRGTEDEDRIKELESSNDELVTKLEKAEDALGTAETKIADLEDVESEDVLLINEELRDTTVEVLKDANDVLTRVPGQRSLAQRAIHLAELLGEIEETTVVVDEEDGEPA